MMARRQPDRLVYYALTLTGLVSMTVGVGLVFLPAALVLAGLAIAGLGLIGLGMRNR